MDRTVLLAAFTAGALATAVVGLHLLAYAQRRLARLLAVTT